jgi:hypothetical protein
MTQDEMVNQNLDLLSDFMNYAFDHPDILDQIPLDATLVILPKENMALYKANLEIAKKSQKQNKFVITGEWDSPQPVSPHFKVIPKKESRLEIA